MTVFVDFKSRVKSSENTVRLLFSTEVQVTRELMQTTFLTLAAELGGYLGMILGVSFLDLNLLFQFCHKHI